MTISSATPRKAGPFLGNGVTVAFPFAWKVFQASDIQVIKTSTTGVESTLGLNSDYSVALNADQNANPGGTVTYPISGSLLASGQKLTILGALPALQGTHITNGGNFFANNVEDEFDYLTILAQQLNELASRAIILPASDNQTPVVPTAAARLGKFLRMDPVTGAVTFVDGIASNALAVPVTVSQGGTSATTVSQALANLGLIDTANELQVSGATSLDSTYLNRSVVLVDSGSPANYNVNLPTAAPQGSIISVRVSQTATKLYTLTGVDFGLDGSASRVLWRGESCLLLREAANWTKIGGRTIPFRGVLQRSASQSIASGTTWQKCLLTVENGDPTALALCFDSVNNRFKSPRQAGWVFNGYLSLAATVTVSTATAGMALSVSGAGSPTAVPSTVIELPYAVGDGRGTRAAGGTATLNVNDYVELLGRIYNGTIATPTFEYAAGVIVPSLSYAEIPLW